MLSIVTAIALSAASGDAPTPVVVAQAETHRPATERVDRSRAVAPATDESEWITSDDYPLAAWQEARTGASMVQLTIDTDGTVKSCEIIESSGHADLDAAACRLLSERARFNPRLDDAGQPAVATYTKRVRWILPELEPVPPPTDRYQSVHVVIVRMHITGSGEFDQCHVSIIPRDKMPAGYQDEVCAQNRIALAPPTADAVPEGGAWIEARNMVYFYLTDPHWDTTEQGEADPQTSDSPSITPPAPVPAAPLPPGHT